MASNSTFPLNFISLALSCKPYIVNVFSWVIFPSLLFIKVFSNLSNFDGAQKIGYLFLYKGTYIRPIFKEKLFILTSIGLLMFDEPNSDPSKLYPVIGSTVEKLEGTKYGRENCFQLTLLSGKVKIFATRKKREMDSWLKEFDKINKEFQSKMKQLDTINKKFMDNLSKNSA